MWYRYFALAMVDFLVGMTILFGIYQQGMLKRNKLQKSFTVEIMEKEFFNGDVNQLLDNNEPELE